MGRTETTFSLRCSAPKCEDRLQLVQSTQHAYGLEGGHLQNALQLAGTAIGWRRVETEVFCPKHSETLVCSRCGEHDCFCMGGPRFDALRP